ncbi:toxin-antitoxin system YwqK family antitoxin [Robiginitalea sediminis]|uniref:toxin-antitoxin system YwqK family antitoxin n=1 Tax=Robiginitalea sediminis TaxID=1982593 RepID=UPI000B4B225D|nr:nicotinic acid mononucleotide adenyltransferase [Robiginitalea sediminis]
MRVVFGFIALMIGFGLQAQTSEPVVEKEGKSVKATYFHENGEVAQVGYFLNGQLHGEWKMYDVQGRKIAMGQYVEGKKSGKWFFWSGEGLKEVDYNNNQIASVTQWNNGEAVAINR